MGKHKKSFINRKEGITFHLVHRSQHDPLIVDENAPQRVLVEETSRQSSKQPLDETKRKEEQRKYGIYFDDEYDYLQHLKKSDEVVWECIRNEHLIKTPLENETDNGTNELRINLPSSVFPCEYEEEVGMLNKAASQKGPRPDWDPDIVAALDDDFDHDDEENQLEDDFVLKAMNNLSQREECDNISSSEDNENYVNSSYERTNHRNLSKDYLAPLYDQHSNEEIKSRFTEYSMSSSVVPRSEQLTLLDDRFEHFYINYDDPELGDLAGEMIEGSWHQKHPYIMNCYKAFKKSKQLLEYNKDWDRERLEKYTYIDEDDSNVTVIESDIEDKEDNKWDCESILTTYSNTRNCPNLIEEPKKQSGVSRNHFNEKINVNSQTNMPVSNYRQLTSKLLLKLDVPENKQFDSKSLCTKSITSTLSVLSIRPKNETLEEKKERKRLLREYRNERRLERKANTIAFKEEKKRQVRVKLNQQQNQQGSRIL